MYHSDADGVVKLVHENTDDGRREQQQDERIFELQRERERETMSELSEDLHHSRLNRFRGPGSRQ